MSILSKSKMAAIAINKSLLKEYKTGDDARVVYMNNGDEFQIQLFNPTQNVIGAEISINSDKLSGLIVLKPGERIWLERYLDTAKKFKFSTYEVDGNDSEVIEAIKNNGEVKIRFYRERKRRNDGISITTRLNEPWYGYSTLLNKMPSDKAWTNIDCNINTSDTISDLSYGSTVCATSAKLSSCYNSAVDAINSISDTNNVKVETASTISPATLYCQSLNDNYCCAKGISDSNDTVLGMSSTAVSNTIETGRIDEGSYSSQTFKTVNNDFEYYPFETEVIKILPASRKPYSSSDLQKVYCTECGRKLNPKHKFCPYCGTKVE